MLGSGTLANDAVAAQIATWGGHGIVLANGEFGERLVDHARRFALDFEIVRADWGEGFDVAEIARRLDDTRARWLWMTACETSTSVLNDWEAVAAECRLRGARIALDAVSAVGCVPIDLSRIDLATAVSGKGLGAYPGLAIVFHKEAIAPCAAIPRYLDIGLWADAASAPFTHSSNLVRALRAALERADWDARLRERAEIGTWLRARLASLNLKLIGGSAPHVITIDRGDARDAAALGASLAEEGFLVAWESAYLRRRHWIQIALMGETTRRTAAALFRAVRAALAP
jgi:aspartate aminotransferase-like enzyme